MKKVIKRIDENKNVFYYATIAQASKDIQSKYSHFAVQLLIAQALINNTKAFKSTWSYDKI